MGEIINVYDKDGTFLGNQDRDIFTSEQKQYYFENGEVQKSAGSVGGFLLNRKGEIRLVKRGNTKESSFLYDKTVGGHANLKDRQNPHKTLRREMKEELGVKVKIAKKPEEFEYFLKTVDLTKRAVVMVMDHDKWLGVKVDPKKPGDKSYERRFNATIYYGIYEGEFDFDNNEAVEGEDIKLDDLSNIIKANPHNYTQSLVDMIERYSDKFKKICK